MADSDNDSGGGGGNAESSAGSLMAGREQDRFLPIANVSRIMKKALPANAKISKDAKETVQECVSEFISFITGEASDKCQKEKRKTINGDDLLWAMTTLGFEEYIDPLKVYLQKFRELEGEKTAITLGGKSQGDRDADVSVANTAVNLGGFGGPSMYGMMPQGGMMMMGSGGHPHHMYGSGGGAGSGSPSPGGRPSSSSVGHEWFPDTREPRSRKRKRGTEMKLQLAHMENWVSSLMEKQEQMLKQLMEMIEDQEKERIARVKFLRLHAFARMILKMVRATRCNNGTPIYSGSIISCFSSVWGYFLLDILGSC